MIDHGVTGIEIVDANGEQIGGTFFRPDGATAANAALIVAAVNARSGVPGSVDSAFMDMAHHRVLPAPLSSSCRLPLAHAAGCACGTL